MRLGFHKEDHLANWSRSFALFHPPSSDSASKFAEGCSPYKEPATARSQYWASLLSSSVRTHNRYSKVDSSETVADMAMLRCSAGTGSDRSSYCSTRHKHPVFGSDWNSHSSNYVDSQNCRACSSSDMQSHLMNWLKMSNRRGWSPRSLNSSAQKRDFHLLAVHNYWSFQSYRSPAGCWCHIVLNRHQVDCRDCRSKHSKHLILSKFL